MSKSWPKVFRDPVHNLIAFDDTPADRLLLDLINTREMQRLRRIKQIGMTELVFPGANHSRFAHSLGVLHTARQFLRQFERVLGRPFPPEQSAYLLAAALLHDVGHGPFSHAFEQVTGQWHEVYTHAVVADPATEVHQRLRAFDPTLPDRLARFFEADGADGEGPRDTDVLPLACDLPPYLAHVVSSQLDADRCDYLLRDSHATGTNYGDFDLTWMLAQLRPDPTGRRFYLTRKGIAAAETYLFARFHMYRTVYFHKTSRAAEVMLKLLFQRLKELIDTRPPPGAFPPALLQAFSGRIDLPTYLAVDDHTITEMMKACAAAADPVLRRLADGLLTRRLYKALDVSGLVGGAAARAAFDARVRQRQTDLGLDPRYCFIEDAASDTPYEPYEPDVDRPAEQIFVEDAAGRIVEISTLSEAIGQLRKTYTVVRYYVPPEFRDELVRIAADTLGGTAG